MHRRFLPLAVGFLGFLIGASSARAQFYAPDTEYHDRVQRHFVVELARVLAWRANQAATPPRITAVTDEVSVSDDRRVTWKIHWLGADGRMVREAEVSYPESALTTGPAWYRDVARQLACPAVAGAPDSADELIRNYWQGAESAEPSRAESLEAAFSLSPEKDAARLAGLLVHAAMPSIVSGVTLDSVLLARGAAWLCIAEAAIKKPDQRLDTLWAPVLFLARRENAASEVWKRSASAPATGPVAQGWGFLLAHPRSTDAFAFAADPQNRRWTMPLLVYETDLYRLGELLSGVVARMFRGEKSFAKMHDYAPYLVSDAGVGGGHLAGGMALLSRRAWVDCLRQFKPDALDFQGYTDDLRRAKTGPLRTPDIHEEDEPDLVGLEEAAPLLNLGFREGVGPLTPMAVVTARDLLNFGWEMNGLQMGQRWDFLANHLGVPDDAEAFAQASLNALDGCEYFFVYYPFTGVNHTPQTWKYIKRARLEDVKRLQEIDDPVGEAVAPRKAFDHDKPRNAQLWVKRCWLRPSFVLNQSRELFFNHGQKEITPLLRRMNTEGGPLTTYHALTFFAYGLNQYGVPQVPGSNELRLDLLAAQAEPSAAMFLASWGKYDSMPPFQAAQEMEKLFWQRPGSDLPFNEIFSHYLAAHADDSARRFYQQAEGYVNDGIGFSNEMGPRRFTLAMMEKDRNAMQEALEAGATGSFSDMVANMMADAVQEDYRALESQIDSCLQRYPPQPGKESMMQKLKDFLPLIPALKDPAHVDHARALDFFGAYDQWPTMQWVLLQNAKLPTDEAVRFLNGRNTNPERLAMVAYLLKDKELFAKAFEDMQKRRPDGTIKWSNMAFVVVHYLRNNLLDIPVPADQADLKPAEVLSLQEAAGPKGR